MVASRHPEQGGAGPRRPLRGRRGRRDRAHDQGARRDDAHPRPGRPARAHRQLGARDALPGGRDLRAARRRAERVGRARGADAQRPDDVLLDRREQPLPARGAAARDRQHRRPERAQPPHRRLAAPEDRGEAGAARGGRRRAAPAAPRRDPRARARGHLDRLGDPEPGPVGDRQGPARVRPAPAARGHPQRARRVRRVGRRGQRAARAARRHRAARGRPPPGRPRAQAPGVAAAAGRRARRHPHLPGVDRLAAVGQDDRGQPRPRARARGARRGPLRHRAGQGPHHRVPRRAQAQARRARLDPVLRRPARRRQDLARALDRARAGAQVRAHQRRRRARRGRDPRPPAHLHRRDARDDHPRAARRGAPTTRCS